MNIILVLLSDYIIQCISRNNTFLAVVDVCMNYFIVNVLHKNELILTVDIKHVSCVFPRDKVNT